MSASAPCKNIVRAGRCTVWSLHCVQTRTVIGRISGKGNLRQARAIWGMTRYCEELKRKMGAGESDLSEFFLFSALGLALPYLQLTNVTVSTVAHTYTPRPRVVIGLKLGIWNCLDSLKKRHLNMRELANRAQQMQIKEKTTAMLQRITCWQTETPSPTTGLFSADNQCCICVFPFIHCKNTQIGSTRAEVFIPSPTPNRPCFWCHRTSCSNSRQSVRTSPTPRERNYTLLLDASF